VVGLVALLMSASTTTAPPASPREAGGAAGRMAPVAAAARASPSSSTVVIDVPIRSWRRLPPSPPVRVEIPGIGVTSPLVRLGRNPDGTMQVPTDFQVAGWFAEGPEPGQLGPAGLVVVLRERAPELVPVESIKQLLHDMFL